MGPRKVWASSLHSGPTVFFQTLCPRQLTEHTAPPVLQTCLLRHSPDALLPRGDFRERPAKTSVTHRQLNHTQCTLIGTNKQLLSSPGRLL